MTTHLPNENTSAILKICNDSFIESSPFLSRNINAVNKQLKPGAWKFLTNYFYHTLKFAHSVKTKEYHFKMLSSNVSHVDLRAEYLKKIVNYKESEAPGLISWSNNHYSDKIISECVLIDLGSIIQPVRSLLSKRGYLSEEASFAGLCNELHYQRKVIKRLLLDNSYNAQELKTAELVLKMVFHYSYGMSKEGKVRNMILKEILDITFPISYNPYIVNGEYIYCKADTINTEHYQTVVSKYNLDAEIIHVRNFLYNANSRWLGEEFENGQWHFRSKGFRVI
jgi:hypothetical protein